MPAPWTRTIEELCADGVKGVTYAHETIQLDPGGADDFLSAVRDEGVPTLEPFGWQLVGALKSSMHADSECIVIWAVESWQHWAEFEKAVYTDPAVKAWRDRQWHSRGFERFLMCDGSPLTDEDRAAARPLRSRRGLDRPLVPRP